VIFRQYHLGCLSHASYLVGDARSRRAVVVDPQRDVSCYLADAEAEGLHIEHVVETHFHADFVSGHLELAARTGADVCYGEGAEAEFPIRVLAEGEQLDLGGVSLGVLATPGHTPESICLVIRRAGEEQPWGILTGDTLLVGDVGRPELLAAQSTSPEEMARALYHSLWDKLLTLPEGTRVFPAHGAGPACGRTLSRETSSTIGRERFTNPALAPMTEDEFVAMVTQGQSVVPLYFAYDAHRNRERRALLDDTERPPAMDLGEVLAQQVAGAVVLDTRSPRAFAAGHLPGSVNVGLEGRFAEYAGDLLQPDQEVILVCPYEREREARIRLGRIGFDRVLGYLPDPVGIFLAHPELAEPACRLTASQLAEALREAHPPVVVDVRNPAEVAGVGSVPDAVHIPLAQLLGRLGELDPCQPTVVYCASGYRSSMAASVMASRGFASVSDLVGGYEAWAGLAHQPALS
jgi:hydroxyacylglutathione hydrolase